MYAANLAQKARELKREKRKSDTLLFQMLPPSVAQQLKQTQQVSLFNSAESRRLLLISNSSLSLLLLVKKKKEKKNR